MSTNAPSLPRAATAVDVGTATAGLSVRRLAALALLAVVAGAVVAFWPWIDAERRAVIVFSTTADTPVLSTLAKLTTGTPRHEDATAGGFPTTIVRTGAGRRHAVVLFPGPAAGGRSNPAVLRTADALARAGFAVFVPDLPGMADGEVTTAGVQGAIDAAEDVAHRSDVAGGQVALAGSSAGATVALLAAEDPVLSPRVSVVVGVDPWASAPNVLRLATTGYVYDGRRLQPYDVDPRFKLVAARSLVAALPEGQDRSQLLQLFEGVAPTEPDPLKVVRGLALSSLSPEAAAVVSLLANTHGPSFDNLYAALPPSVRSQVDRLSPAVASAQLEAPVELAQTKDDRFAPPGEVPLLQRTSSHVHVTSVGPLKDGFLAPGWSSNVFLVHAIRAAR